MKFRKEYQTYLLIVIAIIIAGYFLKHFFFNKKKKVIEGQDGATTYYRIDFPTVFDTSALTTSIDQDLLKELILMEYDASKIITDADIKYVVYESKYDALKTLIPATLLMKNSNGEIIGLRVAAICGRLEYFKQQAAAAADKADVTAAAAAYDYARLILSNEEAYKGDLNIMALIAAANLLTIMGQLTITTYDETAVATAKKAALAADNAFEDGNAYYTEAAALAATNANDAADEVAADAVPAAADTAAKAAGYANAYATGLNLNNTAITNNDNYKKVMAKYNSSNLKAAFITAAGLIYQSVYTQVSLSRSATTQGGP